MIEYRPLQDEDIPEIVDLYAKYLNEGESIGDLMRDLWAEHRYHGCVAAEDGRIVGFLTVRPGIDFTYPHPELEAELAQIVQDKPLAMCDSLLVLPEYRNRGLAHGLAERVRELLLQLRYEYFLEEIWVYPDGRSPARNVLRSIGEVVWQQLMGSFYTELGKYGMTCPICGKDCVCSADVVLIKL